MWGVGLFKVIRVRYEDGVLKPLEPVDFEEGEELILEVRRVGSGKGVRRFFGIIKIREAELLREEDYYDYLSERSGVSR